MELPATEILNVRQPPSLISEGEAQLFCDLSKGAVSRYNNPMKRQFFSS
jgi:hypothetical protein